MPLFHLGITSHDITYYSLPNQGSNAKSKFSLMLRDALLLYKGIIMDLSPTSLVNAGKLLYQLGVDRTSLFQVLYSIAYEFKDGNLYALCGGIVEYDGISNELREKLSDAKNNEEFAYKLYSLAEFYNSDAGLIMKLTMQIKKGETHYVSKLQMMSNFNQLARHQLVNLASDNFITLQKDDINTTNIWIETLSDFVQLTKRTNLFNHLTLSSIEESFQESFIPFFLLGELANDISDISPVSSCILWKYLSDIGYDYATLSLISILSESSLAREYHSVNLSLFINDLISKVQPSLKAKVLSKNFEGLLYKQLSKISFDLNKTDEGKAYLIKASASHEVNSLISLILMYQYGVYFDKDEFRAIELLESIKPEKSLQTFLKIPDILYEDKYGMAYSLLWINYLVDQFFFRVLDRIYFIIGIIICALILKYFIKRISNN
ncbi:hypothetical protein EDI_118020 [Entamoeba dispar SAW760]|uniref:Uncharacterized protein n=1 Tax=Entamoeba dispar (strain ATCC PRA-260 / SAW760) TaxID=370354 RepID=B0ENH8_ENTDS|nr:uncharacterized protein EDI_118020 [Entamoeba dispar SAW760]EDR23913.1 hypothetical protein EDI_118020 [Entamoeba dispar SAW760]|eukprot:EDR23913.1 hypothetical protein EDI_118020 [Entamoeba dispar SAW760]